MSSGDALSLYINKLTHPLKEIRERALQLLSAKYRLGWELDDELTSTRNLLKALFDWLSEEKPSMQQEALELLVSALKTNTGAYIAKELGIDTILNNLNSNKVKLQEEALEAYENLMDILLFLNTVDSQVNVAVPSLKLRSDTSSNTNGSSVTNCYFNINEEKISSVETSVTLKSKEINGIDNISAKDGISVLLFPWVNLSFSDLKTVYLLSDSLKVLKSVRRCCRFIKDVFLRDFPGEIFLNRPSIIKTLLAISDGQCSGHPMEALHALLWITKALRLRFYYLFSLDLASQSYELLGENKDCDDNINRELEQLVIRSNFPQDDALMQLRQLPAPLYALEGTQTILTIMHRNVILVDVNNECDIPDMKELNVCLGLVENLIALLLQCVTEWFWSVEHTTKTHRDIAHKSCMVMRMLGELVMKYRTSFTQNHERTHYRIAWLRLVVCGEKLLTWAKESPLPPKSLVTALQAAHIDPAVHLLYPEISKKLDFVLFNAKSSMDKQYKSRYKELIKLFNGMEHAQKFMKLKNTNRNPEAILKCMERSLQILYLNLNETFIKDFGEILLKKIKDFNMSDENWSTARSIVLILMSHSLSLVQVTFYRMLADMVKTALLSDDMNQSENEKCLKLICDVGILTEICCHGLSSTQKQVQYNASEIVLYLLRGRVILSDGVWWRLLASVLPVLPVLHVYAAHDTPLGKAICKSLEAEITECMGVSKIERTAGLTRLIFVNCPPVQLDALYSLCNILDDSKYLPPKEVLRAEVIMNALRRIKPQHFNIDQSSSPSEPPQTTALVQMIEVLKQDLIIDEECQQYVGDSSDRPALEPSLRLSTLQQLAVLMRQEQLYDVFIQNDGISLVISLLRLSLTVEDYLAFPECASSCVSVLNSICFKSRHSLLKVLDLPLLLLRVMLIFPSNDDVVLMSAQVLALVVWAGFVLQELDTSRRKVPALPANVIQRTTLPFVCNSYWNTSPNCEHSTVEWLLSEEPWCTAVRVRWWWLEGGAPLLLAASPTCSPHSPKSPPPSPRDLALLRAADLRYSCTNLLLALENATSHSQVYDSLNLLECYTYLIQYSPSSVKEMEDLPWHYTRRFLSAPPASARDTNLLLALLQFIVIFIDNIPGNSNALSWIHSSFIGNDAVIISLLSRDRLYPQQTANDSIEVTQLRIHIVKIILRCIKMLEYRKDYSSSKMESLLKILLACLERIDLRNFHMLGYLNELIRCVRYAVYFQYCKISEDTLVQSLRVVTSVLSECAASAGRKGEACRLDAVLTLLALLKLVQQQSIPVQRWSELWSGKVMETLSRCVSSQRAELRAAALHVTAALAQHAQLLPQLLQSVGKETLCQLALEVLTSDGEANVVLAAAASLLTTATARTSPQSQVLELEILRELAGGNFIEESLNVMVEFCNNKGYKNYIEPNVPVSVLERCAELEVRAQKSGEFHMSPSLSFQKPPPTPSLVASLADVVHNLTTYKNIPVNLWNEQGLYRVLFKCAFWTQGSDAEVCRVRSSTCRALAAASSKKCVRTSLASTKDCLYNLLITIKPFEEEEKQEESMTASAQTLYLLASLLSERAASDVIWWELKKNQSLFHLLLQGLRIDFRELQDASMHCITQLARSLSLRNKNCNESSDSFVEYFDNLLSPQSDITILHAGEGAIVDCQPEYMVEEFCKILINIYIQISDKEIANCSQDERWRVTCTCLCSVLACSARARRYGVHRLLPRLLLRHLHRLRDALSLHAKPVDVIRNADNEPALNTLYWVLTLITCQMCECPVAKDHIADDIAPSLTRLWPWCMMNERLREALMNLLVTFTNDCPRAWASVCSCTGGRSVVGETCALVWRESARARPAPASLLPPALRVLTHCMPHHHCRHIIIKNDVLSCISRARARGGAGGGGGGVLAEVWAQWARVAAAAAARAEGAAAVLALLQASALRPPPVALLPALANAAHHARHAFLQSPDLLEFLCGCLLTGDTNEVVSAARAVWALAANNHRAKLMLRSVGTASAVRSARQRLRRRRDDATHRALELLTYVDTVLQTT